MIKAGKKFLVLLLVLSMIFTVAACGKKDSSKGKSASTKAAATPTEKPDKYKGFDFGGRTIKVGIWWDYYYTSDHTKITDDPGLSNKETAQMKLDNVRRIEKKYNCKIKFVNLGWNGIINSINTTIAAGTPECDIYLTDLQFGIPAALNGLCQDLKKIAPKDNDIFGDQMVLKPMDEIGGGSYFFQEQGIPTNGIFLGYNATMIKDLGLEDPQQLYKDGKWTWDKFAELAQAGTKDTDNDGTTDVYGFGGIFTDLTNGLVMSNNGSIAGTTTEGLSSKPVKEAFEFINRLYNKDKSARPWSSDWNDNLLAWSDGKVMFWTAQAWSLKQEADAAKKDGAELPFEYHVVPYPQGPEGDGTAYSPFAGNWYMVPVGVKEPDKVLQIFEEFMNWFDGDTEYRDDPTWFESCFQSEEDVAIAKKCGSNLKLDPWGCMAPYYDFGSTIFYPIAVDKDKTVAQAVETAKPMLQNALDILFKKKK